MGGVVGEVIFWLAQGLQSSARTGAVVNNDTILGVMLTFESCMQR